MSITLYTAATPNGQKVSLFLELLGLKYNVENIDIMKNVQKEPWFLKLNPNGRIPTLVDNSTDITISETGAILQYLADTYDKEHKFSYPHGSKDYYRVLEVLTFQVAGLGPMQGQANHFTLFAQEKIPYGIKRYQDETARLYSVVEEYLHRSSGGYLVGDKITAADVAVLPWFILADRVGVDFKKFPTTFEWAQKLVANPAIKRGFAVPTKLSFKTPDFDI